ncbi:MAG: HlyD family efflux transporter periplasmic adaptor subunit, partial [Patescibacteria group bacterium]|nr:HlyD family efflux transporter periplasmic adaptor subunit [Patescibacteria group bacterium]
MTKKKKIIIGAIIVFIIIGFIVWRFQKEEDISEKYLIEKVQKVNLSQTVSATGDLKSESEIILNFENPGRVGSVEVEIGDEISSGEILANLSSEILNKQLEKAQIALNRAIADAGSNDDAIRELKQAVDNAEDYLEEADDLEDQKVLAAQQSLDDAENYYEEAVEYYDLSVDAYGADSVNAQSAKLTMKSAETGKHSAEQALETTEKAKDLAKVSAENSLNSAKKALKTAESQYAEKSRNAMVESARKDYEIALANLEKSSLKAPVNGVITQINYEESEILGSSSAGTMSFGRMISKDFILEALISESDIAKVQIGQSAELSFDALSFDETVESQVVEIDPAATIIQDVVYYKTKLKLNEIDSRLKEGMSADVDILIDNRDNVMAISQSAIDYDGSKTSVRVIDEADKIEKRQVQIGLEGDSGMVEVKSGTNEGEKIIISDKK